MAYCTQQDLITTFGEDNIRGWSRGDTDTVERAIKGSQAEIDGYLISGGYTVPLNPVPPHITEYCVALAAAKLLSGNGVNLDDSGEQAILDQAKVARSYLKEVAKGNFRIAGYSKEGEISRPPAGRVQITSGKKLDWKGY
jgi:phage gp36-like protein